MKNIILASILCFATSFSFAQGSLENPVAGSTESGIGVISGWHCTATNITATIDGTSLGKAGSGTSRGDTTGVCGRSNTGYSLLFNYNDLTPGSHNISVYADGQLLETRQFNTVQSAGASFVTGLVSAWDLSGFPSSGKTATIQWSQAKQSFVVTGIVGGIVDMSSLNVNIPLTINGNQILGDAIGTNCAKYNKYSGTLSLGLHVIANGNSLTVYSHTYEDTCQFNLTYVSGNSTSGFNLKGSVSCNSGLTASNVSATNIKNASNSTSPMGGVVTIPYPGCTEIISL